MYCPSCGKSIADGSAFCMHCGKPTGFTAQPAPVPTNAVVQPNTPVCPNCGQMDAVRHTAGVIAEGVIGERSVTQTYGQSRGASATFGNAEGMGTLGGSNYSGVSNTEGVAMTALATRLADLRKQVTNYVQPTMPPRPDGLDDAPKVQFWNAELEFRCTLLTGGFDDTRWRNLYYCSRCAGAFVLSEGEFASLDQMEQLLYRYPSVTTHDFCELQHYIIDERFFDYRAVLIAIGYGTSGVYVVQELRSKLSRRWDGRLAFNVHDDKGFKSNYDQMLSDLQTAGWQKLNEQGEHWYQARFVLPHKNQLTSASPTP
jgi:hypothetical protein